MRFIVGKPTVDFLLALTVGVGEASEGPNMPQYAEVRWVILKSAGKLRGTSARASQTYT